MVTVFSEATGAADRRTMHILLCLTGDKILPSYDNFLRDLFTFILSFYVCGFMPEHIYVHALCAYSSYRSQKRASDLPGTGVTDGSGNRTLVLERAPSFLKCWAIPPTPYN